jgi:hypothetical protein
LISLAELFRAGRQPGIRQPHLYTFSDERHENEEARRILLADRRD